MNESQGHDEDNIVNKAEQSLSELGKQASSQAADLAQQTAAASASLAGQGQQKLSGATEQGSEKLDSAAHGASGLLHDAAGSLRSYTPERGAVGEMAHQVAEGLDQGSAFLDEQSRKGVVSQATKLMFGMMLLMSLAVAAVIFLAWLGRPRQ